MYTLMVYSVPEMVQVPAPPPPSRFSSFNLGNWRSASFRSKCPPTAIISTATSVRSAGSSTSRFRRSNSICSRSRNKKSIADTVVRSTRSNSITAIPTTTTTPAKNAPQQKYNTFDKYLVSNVSSSHDTSSSSVDDDEDLYDFDIYEDERRYRSILKPVSKYAPAPVPAASKFRGIWGFFGSYIKSSSRTVQPMPRRSSVGSSKIQIPGSHVPVPSSGHKGFESPILGSPKDRRPSSDAGYNSDDGVTAGADWDHFQVTLESLEDKKRVHFSDPVVTHVFKHSYKTYIPRDDALEPLEPLEPLSD